MRVGIVGAGMAGLGAARELAAAGHLPVVFDSHTVPGGRLSTLRTEGFVFDMGATFVAPRDRALARVMSTELDRSGVDAVALPVYWHTGLHPSPGDSPKADDERYVYERGNDELARLLAEGLELRLGQTVLELEIRGKSYVARDEEFDALIVTAPAPEAARLLATIDLRRSLANCTYRMCLSVALGYGRALPHLPYCALVDPLQRHPLTWLSFESLKCPGRAPEGCAAIVAQLSAEFSLAHMDADESVIVSTTVAFLERLLGPGWDSPTVARVFRWPYGRPENIGLFDAVNNPGSRVLVASDGLSGPRVEYAYEVGVRTARMLLEAI